jgi:hypothetical protein
MFECSMPKIERLSERIAWIDLSFVERLRTPEWAIQVGIRCHFGMPVSFLRNWESNEVTWRFTIGFTRPNYSHVQR